MAGTVAVNFIGHTDKLRAAIREADTQVSTFGDKLTTFGGKAQELGKKMTMFVTLPILGAGVAAFKMAGDYQESFSKMSTVFGDSAKDIEDWSKDSAKAMGLSRKEAIDATGTFGNMFTQLGIGKQPAADMSKSMVQLAADLGSFHNADITSVIDAQSSAFRGEYDALQRYIPTINAATVEQRALEMTGKTVTKELTAQEKALAVQKLMMEGAGAATGDFARTSDGAANKQRIMTAEFKDAATELGTNLLPIGQKIIGFVTDLTKKFSDLSPGVQDAILGAAGLAFVLGPLIGLIGSLGIALGFLAANPVVAIIIGIGLLVAAIVIAYQKSETFRDIVNRAVEAVANFFMEKIGTILDGVALLIGGFATMAEAASRLPVIGEKFKGVATAIRGAQDEVEGWASKMHAGIDLVAGDAERVRRAYSGLDAHIRALNRSAVTLNTDLGAALGMAGGLPGRAAGGPVSAGSAYVVGEDGPELFVPRMSGAIIPGGTSGTVAGTVNHYSIAVTAIDPAAAQAAVIAAIKEFERRNGANWRAA